MIVIKVVICLLAAVGLFSIWGGIRTYRKDPVRKLDRDLKDFEKLRTKK